jgi:hypothetical protein
VAHHGPPHPDSIGKLSWSELFLLKKLPDTRYHREPISLQMYKKESRIENGSFFAPVTKSKLTEFMSNYTCVNISKQMFTACT